MPSPKTCGCLIATGVIHAEIAKKKKALLLEGINKKIKKAKNKKAIERLKTQKAELASSIKHVILSRKEMKKRFDNYIKRSGYVPPKT